MPVEQPRFELSIPAAFTKLFEPTRYKVYYGGRGGAKSQSYARALLAQCLTEKKLVLCTRQYQSSIQDSVHRVLASQINELGLSDYFEVNKTNITVPSTGSEIIFKGLYYDIQGIKSLEGVDICWVEEGQAVSEDSWLVLDPTIRKDGSEIWVSMNPDLDTDPTYKRFVVNPPPNAYVHKVGWRDNPWFPQVLDTQRRRMLQVDPDAYDWVWEGHTRHLTEATILRNHYSIEAFETPERVDRFFYGADWGFATDPTALVRCFIQNETLYVDYEAYGVGVEIDDIPALFAGGVSERNGMVYRGVPDARNWPIHADGARPETISYMSRQGFNIDAAKKWPGSVEDGIAHLKGFRRIVIHERCANAATEARLYSYKVDRKTGEVLPVVEDKHNHCIDALRYALDGYIQARGGLGVWAKLNA